MPVVTAVPSATQFRRGHGVRGCSFVDVTEPSQLVMVVAAVKVPIDVSRYRPAVLRRAADAAESSNSTPGVVSNDGVPHHILQLLI